MAVNSDTFGRLKVTIARLCGDHKESGTATGGGTTSIIDTKKFTDANDTSPRLTGKWLYIWNGASQGTEVRTTAFTASTDTITIPTSTAIDSTSEYLITERFSNTDITTAIRTVISRVGRYALEYVNESHVWGSPLKNGTFYLTSGTTAANWTQTGVGGVFSQNASTNRRGAFAANLVSDGTNACGLSQAVPYNTGQYGGISLNFKCWVWTNTANRISISLADGITTKTSTAITDTSRGWGAAELESGSLTVSNLSTTLTATLDISAGAAATARFSAAWIDVGGAIPNEMDVMGSPSFIERAEYDDGPTGYTRFCHELPNCEGNIEVIERSTRRIRLIHAQPPKGHIIRLLGRQAYTNLAYNSTTADDTSYEGVTDWIAHEAALFLLMGANDPGDQARIANLNYALADLRKGKKMRIPAGAAVIER